MAPVTAPGVLVLAATPLGNPGDASPRLVEALLTCDVIAAEDTRRLHRLARDLGVTLRAEVVSVHDSVEGDRVPRLLEALDRGARVLLVSDAGMPLVSDPGYRVVRACVDEGIEVTVLPGPSAVLAALAVSGLPVDRFCFEGFLPRRAGERQRRIAEMAEERRTLVIFEAPHRVAATLADLADGLGADRQAALCREMTKTYEEVRRGTLADLLAGLGEPRGEITLVVAGAPAMERRGTPGAWAAEVADHVDAGGDRREAISAVAARYGVPRREVYDAVVAAKRADGATLEGK
jgi:16S rRNA (cytidine1402-2'-O)-methyltransferase